MKEGVEMRFCCDIEQLSDQGCLTIPRIDEALSYQPMPIVIPDGDKFHAFGKSFKRQFGPKTGLGRRFGKQVCSVRRDALGLRFMQHNGHIRVKKVLYVSIRIQLA